MNGTPIFRNIFYQLIRIATVSSIFINCESEEPVREDTPELITLTTLTFTPATGPAVIVTATDPDGEGVQNLIVDGPINLETNQTYELSISLINGLAEPSSTGYDITEEVREEADEHLFFFAWTNNVFGAPEGDGNIDNRLDNVDYSDEDDNGLPLGLTTTWTTSNNSATGTFRILLKHQPDLKSENSDSTVGESDLDIEFSIVIE